VEAVVAADPHLPTVATLICPSLRFRYHTVEFVDTDIHVRTLRDKQQYADDDGAKAFFQKHALLNRIPLCVLNQRVMALAAL
jgi:hypothetical protein